MVGQQRMKESTSDLYTENGSTLGAPGSPKNRLALLKRSTAKPKVIVSNDPFRFQGDGIDFKGKFIGVRDVEEARGDAICAEAMRLAKAAVKSCGQHKQRIILNISIDGLKIKDEKSSTTLYNFPVSRISFIARDTTDARAFGFIFGASDNKYKFYGIKTAQTADRAVLSIRDMFQIVFEMKKAHLAKVKLKQEEQQNKEQLVSDNGVRVDNGVAVADLLDLESELHNIEQGVNQLQNIPTFAEDSWPNSGTFPTPLQPCGFSTIVPSYVDPAALGSVPRTDPFGDSFNPSMPAAVNSFQFGNHATMQPNPWANMSSVHSAPNFQSAQLSETNPFASIVAINSQKSGVIQDPFDTQSAQRMMQTKFNETALKWPSNENSAPALNCENRTQQNDSKEVTSLEEAFTKLVDMDSLVSGSVIKKNPFDDLLNPPKIPIATMTGSHAPCVPARSSVPKLVCSGANSDPFSDDFFN